MKQKIIASDNFHEDLTIQLTECAHDGIFVITDHNTLKACWPLMSGYKCLQEAQTITVKPGDENKNLDSLNYIWHQLSMMGATRQSCVINLGGGMVTDIGGFAASTFKRGINFINIPTTLLAMVDASVGGKTGINLGGLKNEVGTFCEAEAVIINSQFTSTLDKKNLLSGYAEMIKHGLISDNALWAELISHNPCDIPQASLQRMIIDNTKVKANIVEQDPTEKALRKALNLGHTIGHAFEAWTMAKGKPLPHGYAVAYGLVCELYLSCVVCGFPATKMRQTANFIKEYYGTISYKCDNYDTLLNYMSHDKKNTMGHINFSLLSDIGKLELNQIIDKDLIKEALDFYRDALG